MADARPAKRKQSKAAAPPPAKVQREGEKSKGSKPSVEPDQAKQKKKLRDAHGHVIAPDSGTFDPKRIKWPLRFDYETGASYAERHNRALVRKSRGESVDERELRPLEEVALVMHPVYREHPTRWLGALGRGGSYEFYIFDSFKSFIERVKLDTISTPRKNRWYAVVEENRAVKFYIDVEESGSPADSPADFFRQRALVAAAFVRACLEAIYGVDLGRRDPVEVWLSACSDEKNSFHLHVSEWVWTDIDALADAMHIVRSYLEALRRALPTHPLVTALLSRSGTTENPWIIDWSVYTPRRKFRMALQAKETMPPMNSPEFTGWTPRSYRPLLEWDAARCTATHVAHTTPERVEWLLRKTSVVVRTGGEFQRPRLPSPELARRLQRMARETLMRESASRIDLWRVMQALRAAYYFSDASARDFEALKRWLRDAKELEGAIPRQLWNAAVAITWASGVARYDRSDRAVVSPGVLQPRSRRPTDALPSSQNRELQWWMRHLAGLATWKGTADDARFDEDSSPLGEKDASAPYVARLVCHRLVLAGAIGMLTRAGPEGRTHELIRAYPTEEYLYATRTDPLSDANEDGYYSEQEYTFTRPRLLDALETPNLPRDEGASDAKTFLSASWRADAEAWWSEVSGASRAGLERVKRMRSMAASDESAAGSPPVTGASTQPPPQPPKEATRTADKPSGVPVAKKNVSRLRWTIGPLAYFPFAARGPQQPVARANQ